MAEPFLGEVRMFSGTVVPTGWLPCDGRLLPINQNQALFSLCGPTYGGDGETTFALPDLRGRAAIHQGEGFAMGQRGGESTHTLTVAEMPAHQHALMASTAAPSSGDPQGNALSAALVIWTPPAGQLTALAPASIGVIGGAQPHDNMQPYLVVTFCIAVAGIFPAR